MQQWLNAKPGAPAKPRLARCSTPPAADGDGSLLQYGGQDATQAFARYHRASAYSQLATYYLGDVVA